MSDVLKAHLDAIHASMALLKVHVDALGHAMTVQATKKVDPPALARCQGIPANLCAIRDADARVDKRSFGNPHAWECSGCGYVGNTADAEATG